MSHHLYSKGRYAMNRTSSLPAAAVCVIGAAGAVLRLAHTRTCYEESGLILPGRPLTALLTAALIAVILIGVIIGAMLAIRSRRTPPDDRPDAAPRGPLPAACCAVSALLTAAGTIWQFASSSPRTTLLIICSALGLAAAAAAAVMAARPSRLRSVRWPCAAVGTFFCLELVRHFAANTLNPVALSFGPECLALGAVSLFAFCLGTARGQARGFGTVCFGLCAAGLCLTALTGPQITWPDRLILLTGTLFSLAFVFRLPVAGDTRPSPRERETEKTK